MTRILSITLLALLTLILSGCKGDHEELFTEATIEMDLTDLNVQAIKGTPYKNIPRHSNRVASITSRCCEEPTKSS